MSTLPIQSSWYIAHFTYTFRVSGWVRRQMSGGRICPAFARPTSHSAMSFARWRFTTAADDAAADFLSDCFATSPAIVTCQLLSRGRLFRVRDPGRISPELLSGGDFVSHFIKEGLRAWMMRIGSYQDGSAKWNGRKSRRSVMIRLRWTQPLLAVDCVNDSARPLSKPVYTISEKIQVFSMSFSRKTGLQRSQKTNFRVFDFIR